VVFALKEAADKAPNKESGGGFDASSDDID
jgi:hypothetical protein